MSIFKNEQRNLAREMAEVQSRITETKNLEAILLGQLEQLKHEQLREIGTRACPVCKELLDIGPLSHAGGRPMVNQIDCESCGRRFSVQIKTTGPDPLNPASYEITPLDHIGFLAEDKNPKQMTDDELNLLLEYLASFEPRSLVEKRRNLLTALTEEKMIRIASPTSAEKSEGDNE